jgi:endonuclease/exonuclease/phosphatase (EEP) superfamily protein YafD
MEAVLAHGAPERLQARHHRRGHGISVLLVLPVLVALGSAVALLLARQFWLADVATFLVPHLAVGTAILAVLYLGLGYRRLAAMALLALLAPTYLLLPSAAQESIAGEAGQPLRLTTFNLFYRNEQGDRFFAFVRDERPDILILQEVNRFWRGALEELRSEYPYRSDESGTRRQSVVILSRRPLRDVGVIRASERHSDMLLNVNAIRAVLDLDGTSVEILAAHPPTPRSNRLWEARNDYLGNLSTEALRPSGRPLILAGDLNVSPWSPFNRRLLSEAGLSDAARSNWPSATRTPYEFGLPTWLGTPIDRILVSPRIAVTSFRVGPDIGSDHLPVTADLLVSPARSLDRH